MVSVFTGEDEWKFKQGENGKWKRENAAFTGEDEWKFKQGENRKWKRENTAENVQTFSFFDVEKI